jgi:hypothetical protein
VDEERGWRELEWKQVHGHIRMGLTRESAQPDARPGRTTPPPGSHGARLRPPGHQATALPALLGGLLASGEQDGPYCLGRVRTVTQAADSGLGGRSGRGGRPRVGI